MQDCNSANTSLDTSIKLTATIDADALADPKEYASIVGGLMFAACVTRPDICVLSDSSLNFSTNHHLSICLLPSMYFMISKVHRLWELSIAHRLCALYVILMWIGLVISTLIGQQWVTS